MHGDAFLINILILLRYGVSRVYSQQCLYVLSDIHSFREKMKGIAQIMKEFELDADVGRTRYVKSQIDDSWTNHAASIHQLNLPDDPIFNPEFDMNLDLSDFGIVSDSNLSQASSVLSANSPISSHTSLGLIEEEPELEIPSMDSPGVLGGSDVPMSSMVISPPKPGSQAGACSGAAAAFEESAVAAEPEYEIDDEGNLIPTNPNGGSNVGSAAGGRAVSESGVSVRVRVEREAGIIEDQVSSHECQAYRY
jgi:hypothetical protein